MKLLFVLLLPIFAFGATAPVIMISDDVVFSYFFSMWVYFLIILFPILAAMALFRF